MDDSLLFPIIVKVAHAPSPRADLVAGHVGPAGVAQAHATPARKRQGNALVQGGNPTAPAALAHAPGANAAVRSRSAMGDNMGSSMAARDGRGGCTGACGGGAMVAEGGGSGKGRAEMSLPPNLASDKG